MTETLVLAAAVLFSMGLGALMIRKTASHLRAARDQRLKSHLDWINPEPRGAGRRGLVRR